MTRIDAKRLTFALFQSLRPFRIATDGVRYWVLYRDPASLKTSYVYNQSTHEKLEFSSHAEAAQHVHRHLATQ